MVVQFVQQDITVLQNHHRQQAVQSDPILMQLVCKLKLSATNAKMECTVQQRL